MTYTVCIEEDQSYQLYEQGRAAPVPFTDILKDCDGTYSKSYPLLKSYDSRFERVGTIRVRDLLMMTPDINPIYRSLRELRGEAYTWADFVKSRKSKLKEQKKTNDR